MTMITLKTLRMSVVYVISHGAIGKEYENEMKYFGESLQGETTEEGRELTDGEKRFRMYQQIVYYINSGPMGKGNRMELSMCVVESIRNLFPGKAR